MEGGGMTVNPHLFSDVGFSYLDGETDVDHFTDLLLFEGANE
jgi:hypothetical protein